MLTSAFNRVFQGVLRQAIRWVFGWILLLFGLGGAYLFFFHGKVKDFTQGPFSGKNLLALKLNGMGIPTNAGQTGVEPPRAPSSPRATETGSGDEQNKPIVQNISTDGKSPRAPRITKTRKAASPAQPAPEAPPASSPSDTKLAAWAMSDAPFVSQIAERFYGVSYMNYGDSQDFFQKWFRVDQYPAFSQTYLTPEKIRELQEKKLMNIFTPQGTPKLLAAEGETDVFQVVGQVTTENHMGRNLAVMGTRPVAMVIKLVHDPSNPKLVESVTEETTEKAETLLDKLKTKADETLQDEANFKVNRAADKAEGALEETTKKLMGF